jgi:hypothetical protein
LVVNKDTDFQNIYPLSFRRWGSALNLDSAVLSLHDLAKQRPFLISVGNGNSKELTSDGLAISPSHNRSDFHSTASK